MKDDIQYLERLITCANTFGGVYVVNTHGQADALTAAWKALILADEFFGIMLDYEARFLDDDGVIREIKSLYEEVIEEG